MDQWLDRLCKLFPPPSNPVNNEGDWNQVEDALQLPLPEDYKAFISVYGSIDLPNGIRVFNFLESVERTTAVEQAASLKALLEDLLEERKAFARSIRKPPEEERSPLPFAVYPDSSGLFTWGTAEDGWDFFWLTADTPSAWGIVVAYRWVDRHYAFPNMTFTHFLVDVLERPFHDRFKIAKQQ